MHEEALRISAGERHVSNCHDKLNVLLIQEVDLSNSLDELSDDIKEGRKIMRVYKQMKMYNDVALNPILYKNITPW